MTPAERQGAYLYTLLTSKDLAKEVRAFSLTAFLARRYKHLYDQHLTKLHTAARQRLWLRWAAMAAALTASIGTLPRLALDQRLRLAEAGTAAGACTGAR